MAGGRIKNPSVVDRLHQIAVGDGPQPPPVVTLVGETEAGKTSAAIAMAIEILVRGKRLDAKITTIRRAAGVRFYLAHTLGAAPDRNKLGGVPVEIHDAEKATVLFIDVFGGEEIRHNLILEALILQRIHAGAITVLTTGMKADALLQRYTGGFCRKIAIDKRCAEVIQCDGIGEK